ncbi:ATP-dependent helicase [Corynebacterium sp.]|uniref:ATP-dependent helicase n=1 Tax=Corynebacterium sp. TaxID=1720 RepID=UPI0037365A83
MAKPDPTPAISARLLSQVLHGAARLPTPQQEDITQAPTGPLLVVAGAGAGKTETMASRVVWMVANGLVSPDQVLGLTFTRKAAQQLGQRIRSQFATLAGSPKIRDLDPSGQLATTLTTVPPSVSTYDSYAGQLIREYGLLVPVEPDARLITQAELYSIAHRVVVDYPGRLSAEQGVAAVTETLLKLVTEMDNELFTVEQVAEESRGYADLIETLPKAPRQRDALSQKVQKWVDAQRLRVEYLPLAAALKEELHRLGVVTFNEQMSVAAKLARDQPAVRASQRTRFRVVMLDEYQDTSHAQRVLLSHLFGRPAGTDWDVDECLTVTAVGDPMQAIYGWRGATVENLEEFVNDFPVADGPAPKKQLTTSWRNPGGVLSLANAVSDAVFGDAPRPVEKLQPRAGAGDGEIALGLFAEQDEEIAFVADRLAEEFHAAQETGEAFSGAVLVRKNRHSVPMAEALAERGIPHEIVGLGGLLEVPEVADLVALATMLIRPGDNRAALRILSGPLVGLGLADLVALHRRARNLGGGVERVELPEDPVERLKVQLAEVTADPPDQVVGLADAVADLGERSRYSPEGVARLERLSSGLRYVRQYSLGKSLSDLFADIEHTFGLRTEALARPGVTGTVHLDQFADTVAAYHGDTLGGLLDYFSLAREHEDGLSPGEVSVRSDRVQILTAHKAKGLEWDVVAVLHADATTYRAQASTFLTNVHRLPDEDLLEGAEEAVETRRDFETAAEAYLLRERGSVAEENARLFYVAITRTERVLIVTATDEPYEHFALLAAEAPDAVVTWAAPEADAADEEAEEAAEAPAEEEAPTAPFPDFTVDPDTAAGAELVHQALEQLPPARSGETHDFWEREVDALIEEHRALSAPEVEVELPGELTATDLVSLKADPVQFARRQRRPVPFKPNTYAKRGTAFHQWLEDRFGATALLDEEQLPGIDEEPVDAQQLEELKDAFLGSEWADRTPTYVEQPFEVRIGDAIVRGRMDAVFRRPDGTWIIVDWKTGRPPQGAALRTAEIQLAVYREAWSALLDDADATVDAAFHYVSTGFTLAPTRLPDGEQLRELLESSTTASEAEIEVEHD